MNTDDFIDRLGDGLAVYEYYIPNMPNRLGKRFKSPLREERHSSFNLYRHEKSGKIYFKDFVLGYGDCIEFVKLLFNVDWQEAKDIIKRDILRDNMILKDYQPVHRERFKQEVDDRVVIQEYRRHWTRDDLAFWNRFGADQPALQLFRTHACYSYDVIKGPYTHEVWERYDRSPLYVFDFLSGHKKCYMPFEDKGYLKWRGNLDDNDIFGEWLLPEEPVKAGFIVAGNKDTISFFCKIVREIGNCFVVALPAEGSYLPLHVYKKLKHYAPNLYSLYDPDEAGEKGGDKLFEQWNITPLSDLLKPFIPAGEKKVDFAELVDKYPQQFPLFKNNLLTQTGLL